ncbi:MAG: type II toxin-antitoxin system VapC family toxin [Candidatus Chisholmbacteria bacterium]|nr:type II toxin-antitoxin system VapC family toxin [Candidatus Chisholmbacteria bacterium]
MIVIDASVGFKWLNQESHHQQALQLLQLHLENTHQILVPSLFFLEIANALVTKTSTTPTTVKKNLNLINSFNLKIHSFTKADLLLSTHLAQKHHTTIYDMLYAVIAKANHTDLVTADTNFLHKTHFRHVKLLQDLPLLR